jgi:sulfoxide reductase catalytic subunit YedY
MLIRSRKGWEIPESRATPESVYRSRRQFLAGTGAALLAASTLRRQSLAKTDPYPAPRNPKYELDRPLTEELVAGRSNIFDEFGSERDKIWQIASGFRTSPWPIHIGGQVEKPLTLDVDELVRRMGLEERLYRHRCVEAWAMAVPWTGFPFQRLVELAKPLSRARFVRMVSVHRAEELPGWYASRRVFPYYEALSLPEATNNLAFLATGIYGKPLPMQHGAPIRLVVPWKYGLKSIKSIVAFEFVSERPGTFWNELSPENYSWECNVDPKVAHPWPQDTETMLGTGEERATLPFNGYGDFVATLYR